MLLNGADVYARSDEELAVFRRREVGLVYQFYNLVPVLNVVENMTLPAAHGRSRSERGCVWHAPVQRLGLRWPRGASCPASSPAASSSAWPSGGPS